MSLQVLFPWFNRIFIVAFMVLYESFKYFRYWFLTKYMVCKYFLPIKDIFFLVDSFFCYALAFQFDVKVKVKSLSRVRLFATPWTVAHQAPSIHGIF